MVSRGERREARHRRGGSRRGFPTAVQLPRQRSATPGSRRTRVSLGKAKRPRPSHDLHSSGEATGGEKPRDRPTVSQGAGTPSRTGGRHPWGSAQRTQYPDLPGAPMTAMWDRTHTPRPQPASRCDGATQAIQTWVAPTCPGMALEQVGHGNVHVHAGVVSLAAGSRHRPLSRIPEPDPNGSVRRAAGRAVRWRGRKMNPSSAPPVVPGIPEIRPGAGQILKDDGVAGLRPSGRRPPEKNLSGWVMGNRPSIRQPGFRASRSPRWLPPPPSCAIPASKMQPIQGGRRWRLRGTPTPVQATLPRLAGPLWRRGRHVEAASKGHSLGDDEQRGLRSRSNPSPSPLLVTPPQRSGARERPPRRRRPRRWSRRARVVVAPPSRSSRRQESFIWRSGGEWGSRAAHCRREQAAANRWAPEKRLASAHWGHPVRPSPGGGAAWGEQKRVLPERRFRPHRVPPENRRGASEATRSDHLPGTRPSLMGVIPGSAHDRRQQEDAQNSHRRRRWPGP